MLDLALADSLLADQAAGQFQLSKYNDVDLAISNRRPRNSPEDPLVASKELLRSFFPHGCLFREMQLMPSRKWLGSGDDTQNMYLEFRVTGKQAPTNQFGPPVPFRDVAHHRAAKRLDAAVGAVDEKAIVRGLQTKLTMGYLNATCFAEVSHMNLLREHGACDLLNLASYRQPPQSGEL